MVRNCVWFSDGWGKDERRGVEDLDVGVDVDVAWAWRARGEERSGASSGGLVKPRRLSYLAYK